MNVSASRPLDATAPGYAAFKVISSGSSPCSIRTVRLQLQSAADVCCLRRVIRLTAKMMNHCSSLMPRLEMSARVQGLASIRNCQPNGGPGSPARRGACAERLARECNFTASLAAADQRDRAQSSSPISKQQISNPHLNNMF